MASLTASAKDALSKLFSYITSLLSSGRRLISNHPVISVSASVAALLFPFAVRNFREYQTLGRGGYSNPFVGWTIAVVLKPFARATTTVEEYDKDEDKRSWLKAGDGPSEVPLRGRPRPTTGWHPIPHRQVDQIPDEKIKELLGQEFKKVASANPSLVQTGRSLHENFSDALLVHPSIPSSSPVAEASWREVGHIHPIKDHSLHVTLSPQDCKLVIERGWGERHPVAGVVRLPKEYIFIYAPLTEDDVRVVGLILRASIGFMTGSKNVQ